MIPQVQIGGGITIVNKQFGTKTRNFLGRSLFKNSFNFFIIFIMNIRAISQFRNFAFSKNVDTSRNYPPNFLQIHSTILDLTRPHFLPTRRFLHKL